MKTRKQILMLLLVMLAGIPTLSAQTKKEKKEQKKEAVRQLIVSEDYKIDVNTAMPMRGRSIPLTSQYSLQIRNDSVFSYLPYYGRAYSVPYGGGSGLIFNAPLKEYTMDMDKKGNAVIKFSARSPEDFFEFRAKVFPRRHHQHRCHDAEPSGNQLPGRSGSGQEIKSSRIAVSLFTTF